MNKTCRFSQRTHFKSKAGTSVNSTKKSSKFEALPKAYRSRAGAVPEPCFAVRSRAGAVLYQIWRLGEL